jgi:hypothetical protein
VTFQRIAFWTGMTIGGALVAAAAVPRLWLLYVSIIVQVLLFPSTIYWGDHEAAAKCSGAISHLWGWPPQPVEACLAMHLCANEAVLSDWQTKALYDAIHRTPGCQEP